MTKRVSPTDTIRADIDRLFCAIDRPLTEILEEVGRLSVRLLMQHAVEAEVDAFLERSRYERRDEDAPDGYRNGHQPPATVKTTMGPVELRRPKLRDTDERFCSALFGAGVTRTNALEALVISGWVRGLSDRDIEAALGEALGAEAALSKSTVSRICQAIRDEFATWSSRRLDEVTLDYVFLDASNFKMHPNAPAEPVLAAWGIDTAGKPVFLGLGPAGAESTDAWAGFLGDLVERGLRPPLLGISDGAPGLIAALETTFRQSLRQRCLIHRCRNVVAKVPVAAQAEVKAAFWEIFDDIEEEPGEHAVKEATRRARGLRHPLRQGVPRRGRLPRRRLRLAHCAPALPASALEADPSLELHRAHLRRDPPASQGHRTLARRGQLPVVGVGRARSRQSRLARRHPDIGEHPAIAGPPSSTARTSAQTPNASSKERES